jgi:paraquat-inducible protein B
MYKFIFLLFILLPNLATGQFFKEADEVLKKDNLYTRGDDFGVPTDRELNRRIQELQDKVDQLHHRVKHLESQENMEPLVFHHCNLSAGLAGKHSAKAESRERAIEEVIKKCRNDSSDSTLCNQSNIQCQTN